MPIPPWSIPRPVVETRRRAVALSRRPPLAPAAAALGAALSLGAAPAPAAAPAPGAPEASAGGAEGLSGREIARRVEQRDDGDAVSQTLVMELVDRNGGVRVRETRVFRKDYGEERRSVIYFEEPKNVEDTAFLTYDYPEEDGDDDQWLYLPAFRKVRRISASDRGDYFLGTDFTYDDMKNAGKVDLEDYAFRRAGEAEVEGHRCIELEAEPVSEEVAEELGYGRAELCVDPEIWMIRRARYWDPHGNRLKTITASEIRRVQGIWTAHRIEAENHKTGHQSIFRFRDVDYESGVDDDRFTRRALRHGL